MRSAFSSSYSALNNSSSGNGNETAEFGDFDFDRNPSSRHQNDDGDLENVYRSTTRPSFDSGETIQTITKGGNGQKFNIVNSLRRAVRGTANKFNIGTGKLRHSQSVFILPNIHEDLPMPQIITSRRDNNSKLRKMPATATASMEEAHLLGSHPTEGLDEVELKNIQLSFPSTRTLLRGEGLAIEERVDTNFGQVLVAIQGDRSKPAIVTYHDLGLNYISNFQAFFNFVDMRILLQNFCVYHINAPGQEEGAHSLPETFIYPTMDELADQINDVLIHFGLKRIIAFGVGAGANILCRFALSNAEKVDGLCVLNCLSTVAGWIEWGYQKMNTRNLRSKGMTQGVVDYLMWHHFGKVSEERNHDLVYVYQNYFENQVNPVNLGLFIDSYVRRTDLNINRELDMNKKRANRTLKVPVLNVAGSYSPHIDDTVTFNGRLDPADSTWMKIQDCGMVMEEQPAKLSEAFRLFLQGQGYVPCLSKKKIVNYRKMSLDSGAGSVGSSSNSLDTKQQSEKEKDGTMRSNNTEKSSGISTPSCSGLKSDEKNENDEFFSPLINLASPSADGISIEMTTMAQVEKKLNEITVSENPVC